MEVKMLRTASISYKTYEQGQTYFIPRFMAQVLVQNGDAEIISK